MKLNAFRVEFFESLKNFYELEEVRGFYALLLQEKLGISRAEAVLQAESVLDASTEAAFKEILKRLRNQEPIQYILNRTYFCDLLFVLHANVLIPRPETEELVYWIVSQYKNNPSKNLKILDIGTGSGCIAISLAKLLPNATVSAMDISKKALNTALENAQNNQVQINFIEADVLKTVSLESSFDLIVSNPPYVLEVEKSKMQPNVLNFEPHQALFVTDANPLIFYEKIANLALRHLSKKGRLFFEINESYGSKIKNLLAEKGFSSIKLKTDFYGKNRMISSGFH
ncbi:MAG: peptide chain release factor N(5)-glutamine methyltransferase [Flavobacteriales bacterium CG_4_9_14_3_um_filter_40_17]|nr:MAG: peptide chain release factor N(5)-glutamine methyltransferase [Flavobacteriales bacterium CG_4_9_14_3_um_filter_40_17]